MLLAWVSISQQKFWSTLLFKFKLKEKIETCNHLPPATSPATTDTGPATPVASPATPDTSPALPATEPYLKLPTKALRIVNSGQYLSVSGNSGC